MTLANWSHERTLESVLIFFNCSDGQVRNQVSGLVLGTRVDFVMLEFNGELEWLQYIESSLSDFGTHSMARHQDDFEGREIPGES